MTKSTIKFIKDQLARLKFSGKGRFYYAENFEALAIYVGKDEKTYYAHWSEPVIDKSTVKIKRIGKKKRLDGFHVPLDEIKEKVRRNLDDWKKQNSSIEAGLTLGSLGSAFIKHGSGGYRVKVKGAKIKYKKKTTFNNNLLLSTYLLLKTKKPEIISMMTDPFKYNGAGYTVNNSPVNVNPDGRFKISRFSVDDEELTLVAIDEFNNKTTKIVKVIIDIKEEVEVARVYEQLKPIEKGIKDSNRIALIIGVEKYENTPVQALYASNDAKLFKYFANKALGISSSNIKLLIDNDAKRLDTIEALKAWLPRKIVANQSELFVFFSGHGYPSKDGNLYLIPQNGDPRFLEESALSQKYIIDQIEKLKPKSVIMFFDACYSGQSRTGEVLIAGLKPLAIVPDDPDIPSNFSIFSSSEYNQISATIKEAKHGIFSYYLMKGLQGNADENGNKQITNNELIAYLKTNVGQEAFIQNREQNPMLSTQNPDQVLMKYK